MKKEDIKDLIDYIKKTGLNKVYVKTKDIELKILGSVPNVANPSLNQNSNDDNVKPDAHLPMDNLIEVKSPMVGTFYRAANPQADPFVKEGALIEKGKPLCIIEAMKIFNELNSELSGKVVKILVKDADPVEYDQPLFIIEPS